MNELVQKQIGMATRVASCLPLRQPKPPQTAPSPVLEARQNLGNQAVQRLLNSHVIQPKLSISEPGDLHELEADRVADAVMRMGTQRDEALSTHQAPNTTAQRVCTECEEELERQPIEEEEEETTLEAKAMPGRTPQLAQGMESQIDGLPSGGHPLPGSVRRFFEPRFQSDFSNVRVHTDKGIRELSATSAGGPKNAARRGCCRDLPPASDGLPAAGGHIPVKRGGLVHPMAARTFVVN